jgi:hypothetical protein
MVLGALLVLEILENLNIQFRLEVLVIQVNLKGQLDLQSQVVQLDRRILGHRWVLVLQVVLEGLKGQVVLRDPVEMKENPGFQDYLQDRLVLKDRLVL